MGASEVTTEIQTALDGEVLDRDPHAPNAPGSGRNGQLAKKRRKREALAAAAANRRAAKAAEDTAEAAADASERNGNGRVSSPDAANGAVAGDRVLERPAGDLDPVEDPQPEDRSEHDDAELVTTEPPAGRRARRRAARTARTADAAYRDSPAARRAELVATAASIAAFVAEDETSAAAVPKRRGKVLRRLFALVAILMIPASVSALVVTEGLVTPLTHADASFMSEQLVTADQRVRRQLEHLRPRHTARALARTRDATATARSLSIEISKRGGAEARRLQRALRLEGAWLDAVGSALANPRSPLRDELAARDAAVRPALAALPTAAGPRTGGAHHLIRFTRARLGAPRPRRS